MRRPAGVGWALLFILLNSAGECESSLRNSRPGRISSLDAALEVKQRDHLAVGQFKLNVRKL